MCHGRLARILASLLFASLAAAATYWYDARESQKHRTQSALAWSRQVASQAEGLIFEGKKREDRNPVAWATRLLAQGVEPRIMQISNFRGGLNPSEQFSLNPRSGDFQYLKLSLPEKGEGLSVVLHLGYRGFLDTRNQWVSDLVLAIFGLMTFWMLFASLEWAVARGVPNVEKEALPPLFSVAEPAPEMVSKEKILAWTAEARTLLGQLGLNVRDLLKDTHQIASQSVQTRDLVASMRSRAHEQIAAVRAERRELQMAIENMEAASDPKALAAQIRALAKKSDAALRAVERNLEPLATDADIAFHSYDGLFDAAAKVNDDITRTRESVVDQARLVQNLKSSIA